MIDEDNKNTSDTEKAVFKKRIGNTTYIVTPHFSKTSNETINDKIIRLIKQELQSEK